jgi:hypothetical protein
MNYSRRQLEQFGEPLGDSVTQKKLGGGYVCGGGGGGSSPPKPETYDPFSKTGGRDWASNELMTLLKNPSYALSMPGYQQTLQQGTNASQAAANASGATFSGGQAAALQNLGQTNFSNYYNQMLGTLGTISGATSQTPSGAASAYATGAYQQGVLGNQQMQNVGGFLGLGLAGYKEGIFGSTKPSPTGIIGAFGGGGSIMDAGITAGGGDIVASALELAAFA